MYLVTLFESVISGFLAATTTSEIFKVRPIRNKINYMYNRLKFHGKTLKSTRKKNNNHAKESATCLANEYCLLHGNSTQE